MAIQKHLDILSKGIDFWNKWRDDHPDIRPDFSKSGVPGILFREKYGYTPTKKASIKRARGVPKEKSNRKKRIINFSGVNFRHSIMEAAYFPDANFNGSDFYEADLSRANLSNADLSFCNFRKAYMAGTDLSGAKLLSCNLNRANLVHANLKGARIEDCVVFGTAAWGLYTDSKTKQRNLVIEDTNAAGSYDLSTLTDDDVHLPLMVDDIEVAQFIHFITEYRKLGKGLKAVLEKGVLLLGKFKDGGKKELDFVASELRKRKFIPIIFDFDNPKGSTLLETVIVLAGISKFVIANLNGSSVAMELTKIADNFSRPIITYAETKEKKKFLLLYKYFFPGRMFSFSITPARQNCPLNSCQNFHRRRTILIKIISPLLKSRNKK